MGLKPNIIVVGAGPSGLAAVIHLAAREYAPFFFFRDPLGQAAAVSDGAGINAVLESAAHGDSVAKHIEDTLAFGEGLANPGPVIRMCEKAPDLINVFERLGVVFDKTVEDNLKPALSDGSTYARTFRAGANTGLKVTRALVEQVRALGDAVTLYPRWEFLSLVLDTEGVCRGIVAQNRKTMEICVFKADAVILAMGGMTGLYGHHARNAATLSGSLGAVYRQGAFLANCEFFTMDAGAMTAESALDAQAVVTDALGGLWVDEEHMTNLSGLFAVGRAQYQYHGAACLPGNRLLADVFSGFFVAGSVARYVEGLTRPTDGLPESVFDRELTREREKNADYLDLSGPVNPVALKEELADLLMSHAGLKRSNDRLAEAAQKINELKERFLRIHIRDKGDWFNSDLFFVRDLEMSLDLAGAVVQAALLRNESRGGHEKLDYFERDDDNFLKTTKVKWTADGGVVMYEDVDPIQNQTPGPSQYESVLGNL